MPLSDLSKAHSEPPTPLKDGIEFAVKKKRKEKYNRHFLNHRQTLRNNQSNDKS